NATNATNTANTAPAANGATTPGGPARPAPGKPALSVHVAIPQTAEWPLTLSANGSVAAWQEVIVASEISGLRLTEVLVNVGDRVRRGQPLARIASETVQADRAQIRASIAEAEATLAEAQANAERARLLQTTGAISTQQINQYQTAAQTAAARLDAQRARLQAEDLRLTQTRVLASDDGVISSRTATPGAVVQQGAELFRLIRGGRLEWRAEVTAAELGRVRAGMPARVELAAGRQVTGKVRVVAPTIDPQTRNGLVYVDLPANGELRAGMFARGELELGRQQALTLPQSAVLLREGFSYVFRVGDDDRVAQIKVETGRRVGDRVEIVNGLPADARVVATGGGFLADGDLVRVVEAPR
ncbi:MAG: efflux RND transporter periplasmic adaptor subunit, partial [Burkholderiaceae bacterium]